MANNRPEGKSDEYHDDIVSLTNYGLSSGQAKIFLLLSERGNLSARLISEALGFYRVDTYRKLHELEQAGLIEVYLDIPKRYSAIEPRLAISTLLHKIEGRASALRRQSKELEGRLETYRTKDSSDFDFQSMLGQDTSYKLVVGRERYFEEMRKLIRSAKSEVLRITSANGILRTFLPTGSYEEYVRANRRGVKIKMISEINASNSKYANRLSRFVRLRHLPNVRLRFMVVDRRLTTLSVRFDENNLSPRSNVDNFLLLSDPKFAEAACFFFQYAWNAAESPASLAKKER